MNPVLVIGGGPSHKLHFDECSKFKGIIVACDSAANILIENGIVPDYVVTIETEVSLDFFDLEKLQEHNSKIITSEQTNNTLLMAFNESDIETICYIPKYALSRLPSVGITSIVYARDELKADRIILLGFENEGTGYSKRTFLEWRDAFWGFVKEWQNREGMSWDFIVNCSEGGILYSKRVKRDCLSKYC